VEDTVTVGLGSTGISHFSFDNSSIVIPSNYNNTDVYVESVVLLVMNMDATILSLCLIMSLKECSIWTVKDTSALDFTTPFDLSDTAFLRQVSVSNWTPANTFEQYFIFLLVRKLCFCHGTLVDTTFIWAWNGFLISDYVRMPLACQVQEDGTPTFDSIRSTRNLLSLYRLCDKALCKNRAHQHLPRQRYLCSTSTATHPLGKPYRNQDHQNRRLG
jgi:hypothetical protein